MFECKEREEREKTNSGEKSIGVFDLGRGNGQKMFGVGEGRKNDHFLQVDDHRFPQFFQQTLQNRLLALIGEERQPLIEIIQQGLGDEHRLCSFLLSTVTSTAQLIAFDLLQLFVHFFDRLSNGRGNALDEHLTQLVEHVAQLPLQIVEHRLGLLVQLSSAHQFVELFEIQSQLLNVVHQNGTDAILSVDVFERSTNGVGVAEKHLSDGHREALHVFSDDQGIVQVERLDDPETLIQLSEDIDHRRREETMLRRLLKLKQRSSNEQEEEFVFTDSCLSILFQGVVKILHGHVVVLVQPLHDEGFEPPAGKVKKERRAKRFTLDSQAECSSLREESSARCRRSV